MTVLLLRLGAPLQAWGVRSRYALRETQSFPSRSGILGMLAAAQGRRRTDPLEDLLTLRFGVRMDQPGRMTRDFQVARSFDGKSAMPVSERWYLADAVFLAGIEGDKSLLQGIESALRAPAFPLYLGRRSCPPTPPLVLGLRDLPLRQALTDEPWQATEVYRDNCRRRRRMPEELELHIDSDALDMHERGRDSRTVRDVPVSFDDQYREYDFREVERLFVLNPDAASEISSVQNGDGGRDPLDPFVLLGESDEPLDFFKSVEGDA